MLIAKIENDVLVTRLFAKRNVRFERIFFSPFPFLFRFKMMSDDNTHFYAYTED